MKKILLYSCFLSILFITKLVKSAENQLTPNEQMLVGLMGLTTEPYAISQEVFLKSVLSDPNLLPSTTYENLETITGQNDLPPYKETAEEEFKRIQAEARSKINQPVHSRKAVLPATNIIKNKCHHKGCNKAYPYPSQLRDHLAQKHSEKRDFECSEPNCHKKFATRHALNIHQKIHSPEKCLQCPKCGKNCVYQSHLTKHMRKHTKEKPFECHLCNKTFSQNSNLYTHLREFHELTNSIIDTREQQDGV